MIGMKMSPLKVLLYSYCAVDTIVSSVESMRMVTVLTSFLSTVAVRVRPLNAQELKTTARSRNVPVHFRHKKVTDPCDAYAWATTGDCTTIIQKGARRVDGKSVFHFDSIFEEHATTKQVYDSMVRSIVHGVVTGRNGTMFCYGQTGSGKTYTMQGGESSNPGDEGIIHMVANDLFVDIKKKSVERDFVVRVSFIEIYNEKVRDLLSSKLETGDETATRSSSRESRSQRGHSALDKNNSDDHLKTLAIREDPKRGGVFVNSNEWQVHDASAVVEALRAGSKNRASSSTAMNDCSSRSHAIFRITVESHQKMENVGVDGAASDGQVMRVSCLNLVDLAGSENGHQSGAPGHRQREGGKINQRYD